MPQKGLGSEPGMREGCSRWHPDNVSLGESPPCGAAGSPVPCTGIAGSLCATRGTKRAQILSPRAERKDCFGLFATMFR